MKPEKRKQKTIAHNHIIHTLYFIFCVICLTCCSIIPEEERIVEMDEVVPQKNILLLDFTDQQCINCPEAAIILDSLQKNYGRALIVVSIHSSRINLPLVTQEGKDYDQYWEINYTHPNAVIDGLGVYLKDSWGGKVRERLNVQSLINLDLESSYNESTSEINITSEIFSSSLSENLKYQLWIIEDSIVDWQLIGAKEYNADYVHNHVFRSSINGFNGENINLTNGETKLQHTFSISDKAWNIHHLSVVGFIFNTSSNEVYEVKQNKLFEN